MSRSVKLGAVCVFLSLLITVAFQNCSQVGFVPEEMKLASTLSSGDDSGAKEEGPEPGSTPKTELLPGLVEDDSAGITKLLVFVDNSTSMRDSQEHLANKVDRLIEKLRGRDIEVYVTNAMTDPNASSNHMVSWWGRKDGGKIIRFDENPQLQFVFGSSSYPLEKVQTKPLLERLRPYFDKDLASRRDEVPYGFKTFKISKAQWDTDYTRIRSSLRSAMLIKAGDAYNREDGICKMTTFLADVRPEALVKAGDKLGVILITDEDDQSVSNCLVSSTYVSSIHPEFTWYMGKVKTAKLRYSYVENRVSDGVSLGENPVTTDVSYFDPLSDWQEGRACSSRDMNKIVAAYSLTTMSSYKYISCAYETVFRVLGKDVRGYEHLDLCRESYVVDGVTYSDMYDYWAKNLAHQVIPGTCSKDYQESTNRMEMSGMPSRLLVNGVYNGPYNPEWFIGIDNVRTYAFDKADVAKGGNTLGFANFVKKKFGKDIHFSMIVNPTDKSCSMVGEQKPGKRYIELAKLLGSQAQVVPICKLGTDW